MKSETYEDNNYKKDAFADDDNLKAKNIILFYVLSCTKNQNFLMENQSSCSISSSSLKLDISKSYSIAFSLEFEYEL